MASVQDNEAQRLRVAAHDSCNGRRQDGIDLTTARESQRAVASNRRISMAAEDPSLPPPQEVVECICVETWQQQDGACS